MEALVISASARGLCEKKTKVDFQPHQEGHDCRMHGVTVRRPGGKKIRLRRYGRDGSGVCIVA